MRAVVTVGDLEAVLGDAAVVRRYRSKIWLVPGSDCLWWTGALSGRGHGRFWVGTTTSGHGHVMIAHRFGFALAHGARALVVADELGHRCDNPLCQNPQHLEPVTSAQNSADWATRRLHRDGPLADTRGAMARARAAREAILAGHDPGPALREGHPDRNQPTLF